MQLVLSSSGVWETRQCLVVGIEGFDIPARSEESIRARQSFLRITWGGAASKSREGWRRHRGFCSSRRKEVDSPVGSDCVGCVAPLFVCLRYYQQCRGIVRSNQISQSRNGRGCVACL